MFTSLRRIMKSALVSYSHTPTDVWVLNHPSQVIFFFFGKKVCADYLTNDETKS